MDTQTSENTSSTNFLHVLCCYNQDGSRKKLYFPLKHILTHTDTIVRVHARVCVRVRVCVCVCALHATVQNTRTTTQNNAPFGLCYGINLKR